MASPSLPPQRRAQTYDNYAAGPSNGAPASDGGLAGRSQSLRYANPDPPLPSYDALMASERAISHSPQPIDPQNQQQGPSTHTYDQHHQQGPPHRRGPSLDAPFAPVDYGNPRASYDGAYPDHHYHQHRQSHDRSSYDNHQYQQQSQHQPPNAHRLSSTSLNFHHGGQHPRPLSDPNELAFGNLSLTNSSPNAPSRGQSMHGHGGGAGGPSNGYGGQGGPGPIPGGMQRHTTAPSAFHMEPYTRRVDGSASVYSLDSGVGAYSNQPYVAQPDFTNPYYSAANEFLGPPPGTYDGPAGPSGLPGGLARANTSASAVSAMSAMSSTSSVSLARKPSEVVGASSTRRRGMNAAIDVNKPPYTKQYVDDYRKRMKDDPDPEAQFNFAKYLIEAAKKLGDEISHTDIKLGRRYRDALLQESLRLIKKLAEGKEPYADAQFFLANLYGTGQLGLQVDHEKAYYLYLMASKLNHPAATYRSAVCNEIGAGTKRDNQRAVLFYRKSAALGDTAAMYKLGMILLGGLLSQPRNVREAIVWLRRAASQADEDNPHALHELAILHERPTSGLVPHDPNLARELYLQAAQLGYAPAQFKLGSCHEFGNLGCPVDPRKSIAWYTRSAEKGDSEAELALSGWYLTGSEGVLKQSDQEAYLWGRKAANKGLAKAEYAVGYYCDVGIGRPADPELAKRWYQRAAGVKDMLINAAQGHKGAMQRLTELNSAKGAKGKRAPGRPTRSEASSECVVM